MSTNGRQDVVLECFDGTAYINKVPWESLPSKAKEETPPNMVLFGLYDHNGELRMLSDRVDTIKTSKIAKECTLLSLH